MPLVRRDSLALTNGGSLTGKFNTTGATAAITNDGNGIPSLIVSAGGTGIIRWLYSITNNSAEPGVSFGMIGNVRVKVDWRINPSPAGGEDDRAYFYVNLVGHGRVSYYDRASADAGPALKVNSPAPDQGMSTTVRYDYTIWIEGTGASTVYKHKIWNSNTSSFLTFSGNDTYSFAFATSDTVAGSCGFSADSGGYYNTAVGDIAYLETAPEVLPTDDSTSIVRAPQADSVVLAITSTATNTPLTYSWNVASSTMPTAAKSAATGASTSTLTVPSGLLPGQYYEIPLTITDSATNALTRTVGFVTRQVSVPTPVPKFGVVGNSITIGGSPNWLEGAAAIVSRVLNTSTAIDTYRYSLSGSSSTEIAANAGDTAADFAAEGITDLFIGPIITNDGISAAASFANTQTLIDAVVAEIPTIRIWLMSDVAKTGGPYWYQMGSASEITRNRAYFALCVAAETDQIKYVGDALYDFFAIEGIASDDGTHPTNQGYVDLGQIVAAEWMRRMGFALPASGGGGESLTYQWIDENGDDIVGATQSTYEWTASTTEDPPRIRVTNSTGYSRVFTVNQPIVVT